MPLQALLASAHGPCIQINPNKKATPRKRRCGPWDGPVQAKAPPALRSPWEIFNLTDNTFEAFGFAEPLARALKAREYNTPTPIQTQGMPPQLANRDLMALAETGSGKTAAFVLPILNAMAKSEMVLQPRMVGALILAPTRELAVQIDAEVAALSRFMNIRRAVVLGGVSKGPQINALKRGVHVLVATPGRLLDHVNCRNADLRATMTLVIDEADRMFDMGFIRDIRKIVSLLPHQRRTALLSATMPPEIRKLANELLTDPVRVDLSTKTMVVDRISQKVMMVRTPEKQSRLHTILADEACQRVIVFCRTKRGADRVTDRLAMAGIGASAMHGNKAQAARQRALSDFSAGHIRVLVATDIAARGIDVSNVTHVINFEMPLDAETYVHRIGRTARKGESGISISLCDPSERGQLRDIERLTKMPIEIIGDIGGDPVAMPDRKPEREQHGQPRRDARRSDGRAQERRNPRARDDRGPRPEFAKPREARSAPKSDWSPVPAERPDSVSAVERAPVARQAEGQAHPKGARSEGGRPEGARADGARRFERRGPKPDHARPDQAGAESAPLEKRSFRADGERRPRPEGDRGPARNQERREHRGSEGRPNNSAGDSRPQNTGEARSFAPRAHDGAPRSDSRRDGPRDHDRRPHHGAPQSDNRHPAHGRDQKSYDGHRSERPRHAGAEGQGARPEGKRFEGPRSNGPRSDAPRSDAPRSDRPNHQGGKPRGEGQARDGQGDGNKGGRSGGHKSGSNAAGAGGRANARANWDGQKPPKFLKQRGQGAPSGRSSSNEPAA